MSAIATSERNGLVVSALMEPDLARLAEPFPARDVEWRIGQCGTTRDGRAWAKVLAYVTNRAIQDRLDAVCGPGGWRNEFREWQGGAVLCGLSVRVGAEWVTKWDGAENTDIEAVKGGLSGAMKRAAVQWGVGRYLYDLDEGWAIILDKRERDAHFAKTKEGKEFWWKPPLLPSWALPEDHAPPPDDSIQANSLSPAEQDRARRANPQPPPVPKATREQYEAYDRLAGEAKLTPAEKLAFTDRYQVKRFTHLTLDNAAALILDTSRRLVSKYLTELGFNLDDVRKGTAAVTADVPDELDQTQADAALVMLRESKRLAPAKLPA